MLISKNKNTINEEIIEQFEKSNNFILPESYKKFLLRYNGGETYETTFNRIEISNIYGINTNDMYDLSNNLKYEIPETLLEKYNLLNIADSILGDYICIRINDPNDDSVWFKYHDKPTKPKKLADSFIEFIQKCKSKKIGHIPSIEERWDRVTKAGNKDKITQRIVIGWQKEIDYLSSLNQEEVIID